MNRGAGRKDIFKTDDHRLIFLDLLAEASNLFGIKIHAYCLMDNHYHLLIHTPNANLSRAMRHINGLYTQRFNRLMKRDGALFRGRYKAIMVDKDNYLLQLSRYIHLNPVSAKLCVLPQRYKWSSYQYYYGIKNNPHWLCTDEIFSMMAGKNKRQQYADFTAEGIDNEIMKFYNKNNTSVILGDKIFKNNVLNRMDDDKIIASKTDYNRTRELPSIAKINFACAKYFEITENALRIAKRGQANEYRKIGMYACRYFGSETLENLAKYYGCTSHANVSKAVSYIKKRTVTDKDKKLIQMLSELKESLNEMGNN
jgi:REP element-mobilizing transposase RayT